MGLGRAEKHKMMDVPQDRFVRFHLTDSSDELTSLIREVELSFLKARGAEGKKNGKQQSKSHTFTANLCSIHKEIKNKV